MDQTMTGNDNESFFEDLPSFGRFSGVVDSENFHDLPESWHLAAADIVGSTKAIEAGRYKAVNMAGAGVISAVMNGLARRVPFVFGGDGAFLAVPPSAVVKTRGALSAVQTWVREELDLTLRAALIPMSEISARGLSVRVARFQAAPDVSYAMFSGGGVSWFDAEMKAGRYLVPPAGPGSRPDLTGLSCRWKPTRADNGEIASIIVVPAGRTASEEFTRLVSDIIALTADEDRDGHPVPAAGPDFSWPTRTSLELEARASGPARGKWRRKLHIVGEMLLARVLDRANRRLGRFDARHYKRVTSQNSDFRKYDDGLKLTIDVSEGRLRRIERRLEQAGSQGICRFGIHRQDSALITCIVPSPFTDDHLHFIDGAAGGYAMAAAAMKAKTAAAA
jgi:hypothetical protein